AQAAARDLELALDGLIWVGDAAHDDDLRRPARRGQLLGQQLGRAVLDEDARLEVEARGEAQVLVRRPREAVDAAVLAAAVGIEARLERHVGAVVARDDRARGVAQKSRARVGALVVGRVGVGDVVDLLEAVGRVLGRASRLRGL